jgi:3-hydroxy-9,10-secoandrosta-1,3,5(10)-triene-9,17-dione monooxygenase
MSISTTPPTPSVAAPHATIGSGEAVLQRACDLIPTLRARAEETERLRELPPATTADLRRTGVHRVFQPARFGGSEAPFRIGVEVLAALGRGCASTAWVVVQNMTHNLMLAHWPDAAQQEVWGGQPDALLSGILIPGVGRARRVPGGYVLSGRWPFVSGVNVCDWALFTAFVPNDQGEPEDRHFIIPRREFAILDTWYAVGLRGSSSNDVAVDEVFIPEHRSITVADLKGGAVSPGSRHNTAPIYRAPLYAFFGMYIAAAALGAAEATVEHYLAQVRRRVATMTGGAMAQYTTQQVKVAEAAASVETARMLLLACADEGMAITAAGRLPTDAERTRFRCHAAFAGKLATRAVEIVWEAGGGSAIYDANPISRGFRDVTTANRHTTQAWDLNAATHGRVLLGLPLDNPAL